MYSLYCGRFKSVYRLFLHKNILTKFKVGINKKTVESYAVENSTVKLRLLKMITGKVNSQVWFIHFTDLINVVYMASRSTD